MSPGGRRVGQVVLPRQGYRWRNWAKVPDGATTGRVGLLAAAVALPMFAQCFQYMIDIPPLYFLDKAWASADATTLSLGYRVARYS